MAETIQHILEVKGEIGMYNKLLTYIQKLLRKGKCNKKAIESLLSLMLANRDFFIDKMDEKDTKLELWQHIGTGEFSIKEYDKSKIKSAKHT